jgi:hypothetical protein
MFYLAIDHIHCEKKVAQTVTATGFLVSADGLVLTAAHSFKTDNCEHEIRGVRGTQVRETGPTPDAPAPLKLVVTAKSDVSNDLAFLRIDGPVPPSMQAQWLCLDYQPRAGEQLFAFGYPYGKPLTPLPINFSRRDVRTGFWIVSGLMINGMSGGPVLDGFGNVVGFIQGGLLLGDNLPPVHAVQYVAPVKPVSQTIDRSRLRLNCGFHEIPVLKTIEDDVRITFKDKEICGFGVPEGFTARYSDAEKRSLIITADRAKSSRLTEAGGLEASRFRVEIKRIFVTQYGLRHSNFEIDRDILACAAASQWLRDGNDPDIDNLDLLNILFKATRSFSALKPRTFEQCTASSKWPSTFIRGRTIVSSDTISLPVSNIPSDTPEESTDEQGRQWRPMLAVEHHPLNYTRQDNDYFGSFVFFSVKRALAMAEKDAKEGRISGDAMRAIFDSNEVMRLHGFKAECQAYDNIDFEDFRRACHAILGRAVFKSGNTGGDCIGYWKY